MTKYLLKYITIIGLVLGNLNYVIAIDKSAINIQQDLKTKLEQVIDDYKTTHALNAIYSVTQNNQLLITGAAGFNNLETKQKWRASDSMAIASGTKQMVAALILKLSEQGKLNVNDKVSKYLTKDSYYFAGKLPEWADKITIHNLLNHTSGLAEYIPALKLNVDQAHKDINKSIIDFATATKLDFEPGARFSYSDTGYVVLGLIVEQISGQDLASFMQENLFKPLKMSDTRLASLKEAVDYQNGKNLNMAARYFAIPTGSEPKYVPVDNKIILAPFSDGGVISNLNDLSIWQYALHNGLVLNAKSYKMMTTAYIKTPSLQGYDSSMGYGIYIIKTDKHKFYMHGGNAIGIRGEYIYIPEQKIAINILSNIAKYEPKELAGKIDYNLAANQVDIIYLANKLLETIFAAP